MLQKVQWNICIGCHGVWNHRPCFRGKVNNLFDSEYGMSLCKDKILIYLYIASKLELVSLKSSCINDKCTASP